MKNKVVFNLKEIINLVNKYNIFSSEEEMMNWILKLNNLEIKNILSLNIEPESIKFDSKILIDKNLLNTLDYSKRVEALVSIQNAEGWYHLFDRLVGVEFLNSERFYQDIETLKRAECAQTPLWIIGEPVFINSPYHEEDFELLVTARDVSEKHFDYVVWAAIATIAENEDSIRSCYHRQDLQTIIKYGSDSLQLSHSYPERCINYLAVNPISLKDNYHLENMEILAQNTKIGNFLYAVMTDSKAIKMRNYRTIINKMVENKDNISYVFLLCYYAVGAKAVNAQNILERNYYYEINNSYDIKELLKKIDEELNVIDCDFKEVNTYELECCDVNEKSNNKVKSLIKKFLTYTK